MPESLGWIMGAGENIVIELEEKRSRKCIQPRSFGFSVSFQDGSGSEVFRFVFFFFSMGD